MGKMTDALVVIAAVLVAGACVLPSGSAEALSAGSVEDSVSLPYIDDVNEWGAGKSVVTIAVCGKDKALKKARVRVVDCKSRKRVKVDRLGRSIWAAVLKDGHVYKVSVKVRGCKAKSIKFGVCK